jgi:AhpD family alkylhydroperoxidase
MNAKILLTLMSLICSLSFAKENAEHSKALTEIKSTFGMVPTFMKDYPQEGLPGAWMEFKSLQLSPTTMLAPKTKELIGLAVAAQIPCRYCVYFHKKSAAFNGASEEEMKLAIAVSANERKWSTYFSGSQQDLGKFKSEIDKITSFMKNPPAGKNKEVINVVDAKTAYRDMENTLGFVPEFIKSYPEAAMAGAWREFKEVEMNPQTVVPAKVKDLISLAVSSQVPCSYCIYADTEFAKIDGANSEEIKEAIAMAGMVRHWSTVLNGLRQDDKVFEKEVDQIFNHLNRVKALAPKTVSSLEN